MFTEAIMDCLNSIYSTVGDTAGDSTALVSPLKQYSHQLYTWATLIMKNAIMPVSMVILALFALLELQRISVRMESVGSSNIPAEMVFKLLFKVALAKMALDSIPIIMEAIYEVSTFLTTTIKSLVEIKQNTNPDLSMLRELVEDLDFGQQVLMLLTCSVVELITWIATIISGVIVTARFIEIYVFFAVSPLPASTFLHDEFSSIGKGFLKNFAAVCLQGTLIFLVMSFFPILMTGALAADVNNVKGALTGALGYAVVLVISIFSTNRWSKAIVGAA